MKITKATRSGLSGKEKTRREAEQSIDCEHSPGVFDAARRVEVRCLTAVELFAVMVITISAGGAGATGKDPAGGS